jgi:hypothetical protein
LAKLSPGLLSNKNVSKVIMYPEKNKVKVFFFEKLIEMLDGIVGLVGGTPRREGFHELLTHAGHVREA